jgi:hypothetical protein
VLTVAVRSHAANGHAHTARAWRNWDCKQRPARLTNARPTLTWLNRAVRSALGGLLPAQLRQLRLAPPRTLLPLGRPARCPPLGLPVPTTRPTTHPAAHHDRAAPSRPVRALRQPHRRGHARRRRRNHRNSILICGGTAVAVAALLGQPVAGTRLRFTGHPARVRPRSPDRGRLHRPRLRRPREPGRHPRTRGHTPLTLALRARLRRCPARRSRARR